MIPLRSTERVYSTPVVTIALIVVNVVIFLYQYVMPSEAYEGFLMRYAIVPDRLHYWTLLTSTFLHGGWMHLLGNMLFLWVFGRNLEDVMGAGKFLLFYMLCGVAAGLTQVAINPYSRIPTIGASGAIAGVMGGYLLKFPKARIVTLVPIFIFLTSMEIPAAFLLAYWFIIQFFSGVGSLASTHTPSGGTAWFAHIGGFIVGMLLVRTFATRQIRTRRWDLQ